MAWTTNDTVMEYRERYRAFDVFAETMDGWRRHQSSKNAWLLAFFTFLSIFPLLLAAVTILGIVLEGNEDLRQRILSGAMSEIPVLGEDLSKRDAISGGIWALLIGLGGALWSSGKAFVGLQSALDDTWEVPIDDRAGLPAQRGKALLGVAIIGASQIGNIVIASLVSAAGFGVLSKIALVATTVAINILVIAAMYRFLTSYTPTWSAVWIGAIIAGIIFTILQNLSTTLVKNFAGTEEEPAGGASAAADAANDGGQTLQVLGLVIGLITWMSFVGITVVMCAELNAARKRLGDGKHVERGEQMDIAIRN